ncbi:MAG TPA: DegT/DnrJ/EryC1/StrS family aminotransferase [Burkholderiales bacterium]|nr:DegT/DnrJ/EryC1/StrS family aminotransferase [Burkholderiales bacterium]
MKPITVTQPFLPPLQEFLPYLESIWDSKWLTNGGPFHQQLESELARRLGVGHIALFANGTLALVTALQALRITGEVITTPYSFVATAHSLLWNGIKPVFVDIHPETLNLDPARIEEAITPQTTAIMPVHVYGRPCDVNALQKIAETYGLKLIYDAAPAFGVTLRGESLLRFGDLSILSFHATKVFTTCEGGAIVCPDTRMKQRIDYLKNFGFADEVTVVAPGINGKMNEMQAALGLLQLKHVGASIASRRAIDSKYRQGLRGVRGIRVLPLPAESEQNFSYFPVLVEEDFPIGRDALYDRLRQNGIHARRYFYPLISEFPMYRALPSAAPGRLPVASAIARKILCLPIYPGLAEDVVERVIRVVREA